MYNCIKVPLLACFGARNFLQNLVTPVSNFEQNFKGIRSVVSERESWNLIIFSMSQGRVFQKTTYCSCWQNHCLRKGFVGRNMVFWGISSFCHSMTPNESTYLRLSARLNKLSLAKSFIFLETSQNSFSWSDRKFMWRTRYFGIIV